MTLPTLTMSSPNSPHESDIFCMFLHNSCSCVFILWCLSSLVYLKVEGFVPRHPVACNHFTNRRLSTMMSLKPLLISNNTLQYVGKTVESFKLGRHVIHFLANRNRLRLETNASLILCCANHT